MADAQDFSAIDDVKRYDRQIRLWGAATQRGIQGAKVLVLGANGLSNEVCKNLVLAGVGTVVIQDADVLTEADLTASALFSVDSKRVGVSRAQLLTEQLKDMNPSVKLDFEHAKVSSFDDAFLRAFHYIICASRGAEALREAALCTSVLEGRGGADEVTGEAPDEPPAKRHRANGDSGPALARNNGAHLVVPLRALCERGSEPMPRCIACGTIGLEGFCFFDLGESRCVLAAKRPSAEAAASEPPPADVSERAYYPTIASASAVEWPALTNRVPRVYHGLQLLLHASGTSAPTAAPTADATSLLPAGASKLLVERLQAMLTKRAELLHGEGKAGVAEGVTAAYLAELAQNSGYELAPVCAVVGGMVANEVIKVISGKERPINNTFFFDGKSCDGVCVRLGPSFDCPWGLDKGDYKALAPP